MADFPDIIPDDDSSILRANNQVFDSTLTGETQTLNLSGDRWSAQPSFSNRIGLEARQLKAFVFGLGGVSGRFNYSPFDIDQQGTMSGAGVVDGAFQTGSTLNTKGWDASQPELFQVGDFLSFNGEMKMVTESVASDAGGLAAIKVAPKIRISPADNNDIEVAKPFFIARLEDDDQARTAVSAPIVYNATFSIVEAF